MNQLSNSIRFSFGIGQLAEGIKNSSFSLFLLFYYNQVLGLSGELAGLALAISILCDAVTDPMVGSISDRWHGPRGRRHPFMYASALPLAITFYFLFAPAGFANSDNQGMLFAWMLVFTVLNRTAMTFYHVPHLALGAELSSDYDERTRLVAIRQFISNSGHIVVFAMGFGLFFTPTEAFENGQLNAAAYPPFALCLGVIMFISIWWSAWGTRSCIPHLPKPSGSLKNISIKGLFLENLQAMKSRSFIWLMLGYTIIVVVYGVGSASTLYMFTFFWELSRFQVMLVLLSSTAGGLFGYVIATRLFAKLDKRNAMVAGGMCWMFFHALPVTLYLLGLVPEKSTTALTAMLAVNYLLLGASIAQLIVGASSTMADIADESELATGSRQEGVLFGAASFAAKCTNALGSLIAGSILRFIEWPTGDEVKTAADIAPETLQQMAIIFGPCVALLAIPGFFFLRGYKLDRAKTREIQRQLKERSLVQEH